MIKMNECNYAKYILSICTSVDSDDMFDLTFNEDIIVLLYLHGTIENLFN